MSITLNKLFDAYMEHYARQYCRTWRNMERCYDSYLRSTLGDKPVSEITRFEIQCLLTKLGASAGHTTANRVVELLRPVYNRGIEWDLIEPPRNPAKGVRLYRLDSRTRFLTQSELKKLLDAVETLRYESTREFLRMCLFTAARRSNVAAMRWSEINFEQGIWTIPRTKNGTPQVLPLVLPALAVLHRRHAAVGNSDWVFPSARSLSGHIENTDLAWTAILKRAGLTDLRVHDLRRTLASWQAITGADILVIAQTLNHQDLRSTQVYARLKIEPVRAAMSLAVNEMLRHGV